MEWCGLYFLVCLQPVRITIEHLRNSGSIAERNSFQVHINLWHPSIHPLSVNLCLSMCLSSCLSIQYAFCVHGIFCIDVTAPAPPRNVTTCVYLRHDHVMDVLLKWQPSNSVAPIISSTVVLSYLKNQKNFVLIDLPPYSIPNVGGFMRAVLVYVTVNGL